MEEWRPVVGFESDYEVSNLGRVRGWRGARGCRLNEPRIMAPVVNHNGYLVIQFGIRGRRSLSTVHRLVMAAFVGPRPPGLVINHLDSVRTNNRVTNLEYTTYRGNTLHCIAAGRAPVAENHPDAILTNAQVLWARSEAAKRTRKIIDIADALGVDNGLLALAIRGSTFKSLPGAVGPDPTHCKNGHVRTHANTRTESAGKLRCLTCKAERQREYDARRRAGV